MAFAGRTGDAYWFPPTAGLPGYGLRRSRCRRERLAIPRQYRHAGTQHARSGWTDTRPRPAADLEHERRARRQWQCCRANCGVPETLLPVAAEAWRSFLGRLHGGQPARAAVAVPAARRARLAI